MGRVECLAVKWHFVFQTSSNTQVSAPVLRSEECVLWNKKAPDAEGAACKSLRSGSVLLKFFFLLWLTFENSNCLTVTVGLN